MKVSNLNQQVNHATDADDDADDEDTSFTPHVMFMMVDDQGYNDIGYQSKDLDFATPFIDSLAAKGIKIDRYYTMHLCTPARAAMMTARC